MLPGDDAAFSQPFCIFVLILLLCHLSRMGLSITEMVLEKEFFNSKF